MLFADETLNIYKTISHDIYLIPMGPMKIYKRSSIFHVFEIECEYVIDCFAVDGVVLIVYAFGVETIEGMNKKEAELLARLINQHIEIEINETDEDDEAQEDLF